MESSTPPRLQPLAGAPVAVSLAIGLVGGWLSRRIWEATVGVAPVFEWSHALVYLIIAGGLGATAWGTRRSRAGRNPRLEPLVAVNRLVIARASALVGLLMLGAYVGYALSWWRSDSELAGLRIGWSLVTAGCCLGLVLAAFTLERACRVNSDGSEP